MESRNTSREYLSMNATVTPWVNENIWQDLIDWMNFYRQMEMPLLISAVVELSISLVGLAGNAVVFWLLAFCMQRNAFSVYILNLAGADFVCLCTHMVSSIMDFFKYSKLVYSTNLLRVFMVGYVFPYVASLSILTAISTERCLCVLKPIWFRCQRPKHMSSVICALLWALSLLLTILKMAFCGLLSYPFDEYLCRLIDFSIATLLTFCFTLLFGCNLVLLIRLLCGSQKMKLTRLYVTIGLNVLVFLLCGLPWGISYFLICRMPTLSYKDNFKLLVATNVLTSVNSCANPIIYFFVGSYRQQQRQQRRSLKLILQRALQDVPEEDGNQGSNPQQTWKMSGNIHVA
ncbi:mas-related G-protein coupled receptor member A6-like [Sorex fumeus]|uniref:mas-related G-protein coupled receptor member A6-like n=1 Tax=Sorex fumeus TaxID=62283 RepID=UPI0024AE0C8F|nr:mas-related G-protein coupled receptor member A6-like [Sorex fumeus]